MHEGEGLSFEEKINLIQDWLQQSRYTVVFSGAGMSTESGIPDFRSSTGIWKHKDPEKLASSDALRNNRYEFIDFYQSRIKGLQTYKPNKGHEILAKWEEEGQLQAIITQNVDGLHQRAGSQKVAELHGTFRSSYCYRCGNEYPIERFLDDNLTCLCGGFIRPSVVLFGEMLPEEALIQASSETKKAELFIVLGSSLRVSPANYFPDKAKENGAKFVIINWEPTELDEYADIVINDRKIGEVLSQL